MSDHPITHAAIAATQKSFNSDLVEEVKREVATNDVVVVGVFGLGPGRKARQLLDEKRVTFRYLEYGSYFRGWRRRLALKLWARWPTFPLIFVKGTFIGGASDLSKLLRSGEFDTLLAGPRAE